VWNSGDGSLKFIVLCQKHHRHASATSGSHDDLELENTRQAGWVAARRRSANAASTATSSSQSAVQPAP
jgi:hypothetical protein